MKLNLPCLVVQQEFERGFKILVVIVFGRLLALRVHLVRSRGEQQDPRRSCRVFRMLLKTEKVLGQLSGLRGILGIPLKQMLESLKLVQDDQIRFEPMEACFGQQSPQFTNQLVSFPAQFVGHPATSTRHASQIESHFSRRSDRACRWLLN